MVSVWDEIETKLHPLDLRIDDYLIKPFEVEELLARGEAILRRAKRPQDPSQTPIFRCGSLFVDVVQSHAISDGRTVKLTPRNGGCSEF